MEKTIEGYKFDRLRNRLPLVVAVFLLSYPLSFIVDKEYIMWMMSGEMTWAECLTDFGLTLLSSFLFVEISIFYCKLLLRFMPFSRNPYRSLFIYAVLLLVLNNLTAIVFSLLTDMVYDAEVSFFHEMMYMVSAIVTFISYVYTNARYMEAIIDSENQKKKLEINLLKEKEHTAQMQLEVLKAQIDPHFMFNNFSILSELIVEDRTLAERFLENLSNVYRYVIQNLKRDTVPISEELAFLRSYIYLIGMRYEDAIRIDVDERLKQIDGQVPPGQFPVAGGKRHQAQSVVGTPTAPYPPLSGRKLHNGRKRFASCVLRTLLHGHRTTEHRRALLLVVQRKTHYREKRTYLYSKITHNIKRV